eukprot:PITA_28348
MSLENLKMLQHLNFSFNKLKGEVPKGGIFRRHRSGAFMGNLSLCGQWVQLQEGHGDIIQGLTHILRIWINIGPYVIYMPKIEVWEVEKIHIGENHLTGTIPSSIQQLSRLSVFDFSHDEIGGKIPPEIGKLANLTYLNLEWNIFNGSIPSTLGRLQKLERLHLDKNKLRGSIPMEIGGIQ